MKPSDQAIAQAFREYHGGPAFEAATRRIENRAAEIQRDLDAQPSECADLRAENASLRVQLARRAGLDAQGLRFAESAAENGLSEFMKYEAESVYLWLLDAHRAQRKEPK